MGLRELDSGAPPPLGARLGADHPVWDESSGVLRDWDMFRGFAAGGLGVTRQHVPVVVEATVACGCVLLALVGILLGCGLGLARWLLPACRGACGASYSRVTTVQPR